MARCGSEYQTWLFVAASEYTTIQDHNSPSGHMCQLINMTVHGSTEGSLELEDLGDSRCSWFKCQPGVPPSAFNSPLSISLLMLTLQLFHIGARYQMSTSISVPNFTYQVSGMLHHWCGSRMKNFRCSRLVLTQIDRCRKLRSLSNT